MELYIAIAAVIIAVVAIGHALDVRARNKELFAQCVQLAQANGALMTQRDALMHEAKIGRAA